MAAEPFHYSSLEQKNAIRLLYVEPNDPDAPLLCKLLRTTLETCPPYYALSYAWQEIRTERALRLSFGSAIDADEWLSITLKSSWLEGLVSALPLQSWICDLTGPHEPHAGILRINLNLNAALRRFRNAVRDTETMSSYIWVDQICINQLDESEKVTQIPMMRDIYASASSVIIWLGEDLRSDEWVYQYFEEFYAITESWDRGVPILFEPERVRSESFACEAKIPQPHEEAAVAWRDFFSRAWFQRKWCVQELCAANEDNPPEVWCGSFILGWRGVGLIARWMRKSGYASSAGEFNNMWADVLSELRDDYERRNINNYVSVAGTTLLALSYRTAQFQASVPHDRLYALLGIASDFRDTSGNLLYQPSYQKDIVVVMTEVVRTLITQSGYLSPLQHALASKRNTPSLPSWCPDLLSSEGFHLPNSGYHPYPGCPFQACGPHKWRSYPGNQTLSLRVEYVAVDRIYKEFYGFYPHDPTTVMPQNDISPHFKTMWEMLRDLLNGAQFRWRASQDEMFRFYWLALMTETSFTPQMGVGHWPCHAAEFFSLLYKDTGKKPPAIPEAHIDCPFADVRFYRHRVNLNQDRRKFVLTTCGRMGWVLQTALGDDYIFILKGGCVPFLIKHVSYRNDEAVLVGEAYLQGIMHGELFEDEEKHWVWNEINLV